MDSEERYPFVEFEGGTVSATDTATVAYLLVPDPKGEDDEEEDETGLIAV